LREIPRHPCRGHLEADEAVTLRHMSEWVERWVIGIRTTLVYATATAWVFLLATVVVVALTPSSGAVSTWSGIQAPPGIAPGPLTVEPSARVAPRSGDRTRERKLKAEGARTD
jgi:hypothetical protein